MGVGFKFGGEVLRFSWDTAPTQKQLDSHCLTMIICGSSKNPCLKNLSTGTHVAGTLPAKAHERAAKGSRKVQKSVPTTSLVAWHSWTLA